MQTTINKTADLENIFDYYFFLPLEQRLQVIEFMLLGADDKDPMSKIQALISKFISGQ